MAFRNYLPISSIVVTHFVTQNIHKSCISRIIESNAHRIFKNTVHRKTFLYNKNIKMFKNSILIQMSIRRNVVKCRNRNTSQLISAIEHRKQAFKTNPEMLSRREYQHNVFENLQTQTLNSNNTHLRSKHYTPRRARVPTLWKPKSENYNSQNNY